MKKQSLLSLLLAILLVSLSCNLPIGPKQSAESPQADSPQTDLLVQMDIEVDIGNYVESDLDQDGSLDYYEYYLPEEESVPQVFAQRVHFAQAFADEYIPGIAVNFRNDSSETQEFRYRLEIPKDIAANVDGLYFDPPPDEVIEPDPIVDYTIKMDTKQQVDAYIFVQRLTGELDPDKDDDYYRRVFLTQAMPDVVKYCLGFEESDDRRQACFSRMVQGFIDYVSADVIESFCDELPLLEKAVCMAEVRKDPSRCDQGLQGSQAEMCKKLYLVDRCRNAGGSDEDRVVCIGQGAIELGLDDVCDQLLIEDVINDCHARVRKDKDYCKKISDDELKAACLAKVGGEDKKPAGRMNFSGYKRWFPVGEDRANCKRFESIIGLPVVYMDNAGSRMICWYGTEEGNMVSSQATLSIEAFEDLDAAKLVWDIEYSAGAETGQAGTYLQLNQQDGTVRAVDNGDNWEYMRNSEYANPPGWFYDVNCGRLYQNAIITFRQGYLVLEPREHCARISLESMLLLDEKMK